MRAHDAAQKVHFAPVSRGFVRERVRISLGTILRVKRSQAHVTGGYPLAGEFRAELQITGVRVLLSFRSSDTLRVKTHRGEKHSTNDINFRPRFSRPRQPVAPPVAGSPSATSPAPACPRSRSSRRCSQTDLAGRQAAAVEYLLQQPEYQLVDPQLLRVLHLRAVAAVPQTGHRVGPAPSQELAGVLRADERHDRPERAEVPGLLPGVQVQLADIEERQEIDHAPFHGERACSSPSPGTNFVLSGRIRRARQQGSHGGERFRKGRRVGSQKSRQPILK